MGWLIRLLLFLLLIVMVLQAGGRLLQGFLDGVRGGPPRRRGSGGVPAKGTAMVRDPVCGTFVVQSRALTAARGRETAWFCSEQCRAAWQAGRS
jgi:YHS domain-containing protein